MSDEDDIPRYAIGKVIGLTKPNTHRAVLDQDDQDTLGEVVNTLRAEVKRLMRTLTQLSPVSESYAVLAVRLSAALKDYMRVSGADEAEWDAKEVKKAIISVSTFIEKQEQQVALANKQAEEKRDQTRHLQATAGQSGDAAAAKELKALRDKKQEFDFEL